MKNGNTMTTKPNKTKPKTLATGKNEKKTDLFIARLLDASKIEYEPNGSNVKEIQDALKTASKKGTGKVGFPEFVGISNDFVLVFENKADLDKQAAYDEEGSLLMDVKSRTHYAENGALHYANKIISKTPYKKIFAFGCTGDEKHHCIKPIFVDESGYIPLEKVENFENFNKTNIEKYYKEQVLGETPKELLDKEEIIKEAATLHEALRNYGQLGESEKPLVVSAILLALCDEDNFSINSLNGNQRQTDGQKIFSSISNYMDDVEVTPNTKKEKVLGQFTIIKDRSILNQKDDRLKKTPLRYFAEFLQTKILASVKANHIEDILGRFYGEFISFSGGDGQTLGVVLTPSHITELSCDLVDIKPTDRVIDPCCGTGGFLITAMHRMIESATTKQISNIKKEQLHGIEIREDMFSIATTNMILRGDGKSNLENLDFLKVKVEDLRAKNCNVGFINPPYSQAKGKMTSHLSEIGFIKHLLDGLADKGQCVVIVPQSTMVGKTSKDRQIKQQILEYHSLIGVITLNKNTFYGVGTNPCIAVFKAHEPHMNKRCKFINFEDDGFSVSKHIGLVATTRAISQRVKLLNCWRDIEDAESKFMVKSTIKPEDEWLHSFYYFNDELPRMPDFEKAVVDYLSFEFNMILQDKGYLFEMHKKIPLTATPSISNMHWDEFFFDEIFDISATKSGIDKNKITSNAGLIPYVTRTERNNGIDFFIGKQEEKYALDSGNVISIGLDTQTVFYQPHPFYTGQNIQILANKNLNSLNAQFFIPLIKKQLEKFSWGSNGATLSRLKRSKIMLPVTAELEPDYKLMTQYINQIKHTKLELSGIKKIFK